MERSNLLIFIGASFLSLQMCLDQSFGQELLPNVEMVTSGPVEIQKENNSVLTRAGVAEIGNSRLNSNRLISIVTSKMGAAELGIVDDQNMAFDRLRKQANAALESAKASEIDRIIEDYEKEVLGVLLPRQLRRLKLLELSIEVHEIGLRSSLMVGSFSKDLQLSASEKDSIDRNFDRMEQFIRRESRRIHREAIQILIGDVDQSKQRQVLEMMDEIVDMGPSQANFSPIVKKTIPCVGCDVKAKAP